MSLGEEKDCTICNDCSKKQNCCNASCFVDDESNIFKNLTDDELDLLVDKKQQIKYKTGETIIKQNTASTYVICMKEGLAKIFIEGEKGKNLVVKIIGKGDFITGGGLFNGNIHHFTISAITPVTCCLIDSGKLTQLFTKNSQFAVELLRTHTRQNNYLLSRMVGLTQKYMPGRVADTLLYLKNEIYKSTRFTTTLSRQELADMSNMTKESLVRILQQFKESNVVKTHASEIEISDEPALKQISING
ncbi:MAG: Crp/Fnr family transcriptional regulator [Prolixibacteraceae bacterium]|nr:Crp/Fnr family transcriptional regulator [Prolixibacteraceae bacterium]